MYQDQFVEKLYAWCWTQQALEKNAESKIGNNLKEKAKLIIIHEQCLYLCVCEREREREYEWRTDTEKSIYKKLQIDYWYSLEFCYFWLKVRRTVKTAKHKIQKTKLILELRKVMKMTKTRSMCKLKQIELRMEVSGRTQKLN